MLQKKLLFYVDREWQCTESVLTNRVGVNSKPPAPAHDTSGITKIQNRAASLVGVGGLVSHTILGAPFEDSELSFERHIFFRSAGNSSRVGAQDENELWLLWQA
uniref:Uncharacterized protein n=1 Tax=Physcomitrium patens TaxID=3218 RepID=A0A2K1J4R2_PHYPA|nr:hypothetical protein PHYPA_022368 [Physcomitrium patens]